MSQNNVHQLFHSNLVHISKTLQNMSLSCSIKASPRQHCRAGDPCLVYPASFSPWYSNSICESSFGSATFFWSLSLQACKTTEPLLFGAVRWTIPYSSFRGASLHESILTPQSADLRFRRLEQKNSVTAEKAFASNPNDFSSSLKKFLVRT